MDEKKQIHEFDLLVTPRLRLAVGSGSSTEASNGLKSMDMQTVQRLKEFSIKKLITRLEEEDK